MQNKYDKQNNNQQYTNQKNVHILCKKGWFSVPLITFFCSFLKKILLVKCGMAGGKPFQKIIPLSKTVRCLALIFNIRSEKGFDE